MKKSLEVWYDTDGNAIHAHGGCIMRYDKYYYWYGEYKIGPTNVLRTKGPDGNMYDMHRVDFKGISCYRSEDLNNWEFRGLVLNSSPFIDSDLHSSKVVERPKVLFNKSTQQFVMYMHIDTEDYTAAKVGVAVSNNPDTGFTYLKSFRPCNCESRDMTVFCDKDDIAYLFYSSEINKTMHIAKLSSDYLDCEQGYTRNFVNQSREAPVVFKRDNKYYCITSGCTGWAPNEALYAISSKPDRDFEIMHNPCIGPNSEITFYCQPTFAFELNEKLIIMFDKWDFRNLSDSRYLWLEVMFNGEEPVISWKDEFDINPINLDYKIIKL